MPHTSDGANAYIQEQVENLGAMRVSELIFDGLQRPTWTGPHPEAIQMVHALSAVPAWLCIEDNGTLTETGRAVAEALRGLLTPFSLVPPVTSAECEPESTRGNVELASLRARHHINDAVESLGPIEAWARLKPLVGVRG